ncbi:hypothetical protein JNW90_21075 [Micromonospora sp. STR1s_5]|nr:hypothetical protein [Micromonospora sp. STR1s_5]
MPKQPKLKVFCAPMGFYDALIAAPSQKAALKAWGTTTDLFAAGRASVVEDAALQELALARPGEVVKHSRGDETAILHEIEEHEEKATRPRRSTKGKPASRRDKPRPPDRSKLDAAERDLDEAKRELEARLAEVARRRRELDAEERTVRLDGEARVFELERARDEASRDYDRAAKRD